MPEVYETSWAEDGDFAGTSAAEAGDGNFAGAAAPETSSVSLHELSGSYLTKLVLPDSVRKIGNLAFYNCTSLNCLELGGRMWETGSDAFMNCRELHHITLRRGIREKSGIRQILNQISSDMEVAFAGKESTEAVLLFPEYYEGFDEITPAHIFGRKIEGEGFRARQCYKDGDVEPDVYDQIFPKASVEESEKTLCRLAMNRLRYPAGLNAPAETLYEDYIREHAGEICTESIKTRDMSQLLFLSEKGLASCKLIEDGIGQAAAEDWAEGTAYFLRLKGEFFPEETKKDRYAFEEF